MSIELTPIEPSPIPAFNPDGDPAKDPRPYPGALANGDKVRLRAAHSVTGTVYNVRPNSAGEIQISWNDPHHEVEALRLMAEVEHVPPPGFTEGERIWIPAAIIDAEPDSDGDVRAQLDPLNPRTTEGDTLYLNQATHGHRVLRPEVV